MPMNYKIKIAVCDDEKKDCIEIVGMTKKILREEKISHMITAYDNARALLADIQNGLQFHILLLDVLMDEMALKGYEVSAARYLEKPLNEEKLREAKRS